MDNTRIFGNNVTLRTAYLPSGAKKSWIDFETSLPVGRLRKFFFFTHNTSIPSTANIRLQIWEPVDPLNYQFRLKWEKRITVDIASPNGILFNVSIISFYTLIRVNVH